MRIFRYSRIIGNISLIWWSIANNLRYTCWRGNYTDISWEKKALYVANRSPYSCLYDSRFPARLQAANITPAFRSRRAEASCLLYAQKFHFYQKCAEKKMNFYYPRLSRRNVRCLFDFIQYRQSLQLDLTVKVYNIDKSANNPIIVRIANMMRL